tara:strand:+ start:147 stop:1496 length:1350 start_codon:yes stop_codon:yes gene_type:complete
MPSTYLTLSPSGSGNQRKFTFSVWCKKSAINPGSSYFLFGTGADGSNYTHLHFDSNHQLVMKGRASGSTFCNVITNRKFRDPHSWYHIVAAVDTEQGTAADRVKIYVNGVQETSFQTATYPSQNADFENQNASAPFKIGTNYANASNETFEGCMTYFAYCDGQQLAPTVFGSTDSTTGEWKINTNPSFTPGTNGFLILKDGSSLTDQTTNTNNFTLAGGSLLDINDNPSNVFCIMDPLYNQTISQGVTMTDAGTRTGYDPNSSRSAYGTIAVNKGKYYWEMKAEATGGTMAVGIANVSEWEDINQASGYAFQDLSFNVGYSTDGNTYTGGSGTSYGNSYAQDDIIGCAVDFDNRKLYFSKNGVFQNSGDPTSGSTGTGAVSFTFSTNANALYVPAARMRNGTYIQWNFGNGYFRTTAISSAGTNASNLGTFEYDVPTGYTALCTKGLNE